MSFAAFCWLSYELFVVLIWLDKYAVSRTNQTLLVFLHKASFLFKPSRRQQAFQPTSAPILSAFKNSESTSFIKWLEFQARFPHSRVALYNMFVKSYIYILIQFIGFRPIFCCVWYAVAARRSWHFALRYYLLPDTLRKKMFQLKIL